MKKLISILALACISCFAALAQPRAVGGYLTVISEGVYYQHNVAPNQFIEVSLGSDFPAVLDGWLGVSSGLEYNFVFASFPKSKGQFDLYAGPAVTLGYGFNGAYKGVAYNEKVGFVDLLGNFGFDFHFNCHVLLYAKVGTGVGLGFGSYYDDSIGRNKGFVVDDFQRTLFHLIPTLGVAYAF